MTVVIKYDPFAEEQKAKGLRDGLIALGLDVEMEELRARPSDEFTGTVHVASLTGRRFLRFDKGVLVEVLD